LAAAQISCQHGLSAIGFWLMGEKLRNDDFFEW